MQGLGGTNAAGINACQVAPLLLCPGLDHLARVALAISCAEAEIARHIPVQHPQYIVNMNLFRLLRIFPRPVMKIRIKDAHAVARCTLILRYIAARNAELFWGSDSAAVSSQEAPQESSQLPKLIMLGLSGKFANIAQSRDHVETLCPAAACAHSTCPNEHPFKCNKAAHFNFGMSSP